MMTPAERERLIMLIEECGEVVHAASKCLRHGFDNHHPTTAHLLNREALGREVGDLLGIAGEMIERKDLSIATVNQSALTKWERAHRFTYHQRPLKDKNHDQKPHAF